MKKLIVYDFDKTLYDGDSSIDFWIFLHLRRPWLILFTPVYLAAALFYLFGWTSFHKLKETLFIGINLMSKKSLSRVVDRFWRHAHRRVFPWVKDRLAEQKTNRHTLVCISASPEFLLDKTVNQLGFELLIATRFVHKKRRISHFIDGENCKGEEKIRRLEKSPYSQKAGYRLCEAYSDSLSDLPLLISAEKSFIILKGAISPFEKPE